MGDPEWLPHPVRLMGKIVHYAERTVRKVVHAPWSEFVGGMFLTIFLAADYTNRHFSFHGGAIYDAARRWRVSPDKIVDFSANINPFGPSSSIIEELRNNLSEVQWYPDCTEFLSVLSDKLDVPADNIVLGNGSTALIFAAVRAVKPKRALLLEPAFGEYARALHAAGVKVNTYWLSFGSQNRTSSGK